jgi:adenylylsulfate kinase
MKTPNTIYHNATVTREGRNQLNGHKSVVIWFTGLSGSGKSTLAHSVEEKLHKLGCRTIVPCSGPLILDTFQATFSNSAIF